MVKMARPRKLKDSRSEIVGVRLTLAEKQELEARSEGIPLSTFLRAVGLRRSLPRPVPQTNLLVYQELLKLNLAIEQIKQTLAVSNSESPSVNEQEIQFSLLQDIRTELKQIGKAVLAIASAEQADEAIDEDEYNL